MALSKDFPRDFQRLMHSVYTQKPTESHQTLPSCESDPRWGWFGLACKTRIKWWSPLEYSVIIFKVLPDMQYSEQFIVFMNHLVSFGEHNLSGFLSRDQFSQVQLSRDQLPRDQLSWDQLAMSSGITRMKKLRGHSTGTLSACITRIC